MRNRRWLGLLGVLVGLTALLFIAPACDDDVDDARPPEATATAPADGDEATATPAVEEPTATPEETVEGGSGTEVNGVGSEEAQIRAAIEQSYELISDERWEDLWNTYTSDFRERCSLDAMVEAFGELRAQGVARLEVSAFYEIEFLGDTAQASYSVVGFDDGGQQTASYNYDTTLLREDGEWHFEESCY